MSGSSFGNLGFGTGSFGLPAIPPNPLLVALTTLVQSLPTTLPAGSSQVWSNGRALCLTNPPTGGPPGVVTFPATIPGAAVITWPAAIGAVVTPGSYDISPSWIWHSGVITSVAGKASGGTFTFSICKNGVAIAGLPAVTISTSTLTSTSAGSNAIALGDDLSLVVASVTGTPTDASVQIGFNHSPT